LLICQAASEKQMIKEKIILIGGGGHCRSVIDVIESEGRFEIAGIVDVPDKMHDKILGYEIFACDNDIPRLAAEFRYFFITIGLIRDFRPRLMMYERLMSLGCEMPVIISPRAYVSPHTFIAAGTLVMPFAFINAGVSIGPNCIVNTSSIIEHDSVIGTNNHISTACVVNGTCTIGNNNFLGTNATLLNNLVIGSNNLIGASSVVVKNVGDGLKLFGNPATVIGNHL
jgi:sugar O-acyltransferase (sialic acid O-acetyltransferase NeuD family)